MTLRAWIITMRGRVREALCPELQALRDQNRSLRADYQQIVAQRNYWMARAEKAEAEVDALKRRLGQHDACNGVMGESGYVPECISMHAEVERLRDERDHSRACFERASALIHGIHALLYPSHVTLPNGRTMAFRPSSLDPHEVLQELSNRIRALPDELDALKEAK